MVDSTFAYSFHKVSDSNQPVFTVPTLCPLLCQVQNNSQKNITRASKKMLHLLDV